MASMATEGMVVAFEASPENFGSYAGIWVTL